MSFPVMAMNPVLQGLACLFPLRHYFLIYVNLALNGYPLIYAWHSVVALMLFMLLPFLHTEKASHRAIALCIYPLKN